MPTAIASLAALRSSKRLNANRQQGLVLIGYAGAFFLTHRLAALWGGVDFYSLWFPAAGLRFALLWRGGARLTLYVAGVEVLVQILSGVIRADQDWVVQTIGVARPVIAYGTTVATVRAATRYGRSSLATPPMPFGLAAVLAPMAAVLFALPWALLRPDITHVAGARHIITSLSAFAVGDLLGVLLVAPPLLWMADVVTGRDTLRLRTPALGSLAEASVVLGGALTMVGALAHLGLGVPETPVLLAAVWIGLRFGRSAAWSAILVVTLIVLPYTAGAMPTDQRLALHLGLAAVVVVGYLAGSFKDADARARADIARRDRMLFQAERLKTLRAMSVAVIHEISQPLSTLAIEARHLAALTRGADAEIAASAHLIDRKADALSVLVRRLRRFGGRAVDEPSILPVSALLKTAVALATPEAKASQVVLSCAQCDPDLAVLAQEVELTQALVNVLRNAIQACGDGRVALAAVRDGVALELAIANRTHAALPEHGGMGVGLLVARTIVEAHDGHLTRAVVGDQQVATIRLPLAADAQ